MKPMFRWIAVGCLLFAGCADKSAPPPKTAAGTPPKTPATDITDDPKSTAGDAGTSTAATTDDAGSSTSETTTANAGSAKPVALESGAAALSPENTKISFECAHVGPKPDPRIGGFKKFTGKAEVDGKSLKSVSVDIETASIWTQFDKLTTHLNAPDFFDTREHPSAKFESTKIETGDDGKATVTGNLTLMGNTKEISFPAKVSVTDAGVTLKADFKIDRAEFGMDKMTDKVDKNVSLSVVIGEKTEPKAGPGAPGG